MSFDETGRDTVGPLFLAFREDGSVLIANDAMSKALGHPLSLLKRMSLRDLVDAGTVARLERFTQGRKRHAVPMRFSPVPVGGMSRLDSFSVVPELVELEAVGRVLILAGMNDSGENGLIRDLERELALLRPFVRDSTQAMWCMVFDEPVDLTVNNAEIIRQFFENPCHWGLCNEAMARLYNLPPGLDMTQMPVSAYFRRSTANEAFVSMLVDTGFNVDAAPSVELRHDGSLMYAENGVRADIVEGRLHRMWGTVRDVTDERLSKSLLESQERKVSTVLSALPDAIIVIDRARIVFAVNPALEALVGWPADMILGKDVKMLIDLDELLPNGRRWYGRDIQRWCAPVSRREAEAVMCDVHLAPVSVDDPQYFVLSLRTALNLKVARAPVRVAKPTRRRPVALK